MSTRIDRRRAFVTSTFEVIACVFVLAAPVAHAQFAVIDVGAITQLITQVQILEEQLTTARDHLAQAQLEFASITGSRGMERLLSGMQRNYLPASWADLQGVMQGRAGYGGLAGGVAATAAANSVLSDQALGLLPLDVRKQIEAARLLLALQQNLTRQALLTSSQRFTALQQLIDAIAGAQDQKAALDLQARVNAENVMLQNEQSKLLTLYQLIRAEEQANQAQVGERALVGHGQFATRFQPAP
jgi:type IV secretion system protein VirB5